MVEGMKNHLNNKNLTPVFQPVAHRYWLRFPLDPYVLEEIPLRNLKKTIAA